VASLLCHPDHGFWLDDLSLLALAVHQGGLTMVMATGHD
jgi:hypothetical protein